MSADPVQFNYVVDRLKEELDLKKVNEQRIRELEAQLEAERAKQWDKLALAAEAQLSDRERVDVQPIKFIGRDDSTRFCELETKLAAQSKALTTAREALEEGLRTIRDLAAALALCGASPRVYAGHGGRLKAAIAAIKEVQP